MTNSTIFSIIDTPEFAGAVFSKYAGVPIEALDGKEYETASIGMARGMLDFFKNAGMSDDQISGHILNLMAVGMGGGAHLQKIAEAATGADAPKQIDEKVWKNIGKDLVDSYWTNNSIIPQRIKDNAGRAVDTVGVAAYGFQNTNVGKALEKDNLLSAGLAAVTNSDNPNATYEDRVRSAVATAVGANKHPDALEAARNAAKGDWMSAAGNMISGAGKWIMDPKNISTWAPYAIGGLGLFGLSKAVGADNGTALAAGAAGALAAPHLVNGYQAWQSNKAKEPFTPAWESARDTFFPPKTDATEEAQAKMNASQATAKEIANASRQNSGGN